MNLRYRFPMPTFDFLCTACEHVFEFQRPFGSDATPTCPACGSKKTEKQIVPPAIQFKGSGFYKTDSVQGNKGLKGMKGSETATKPTEDKKAAPKPAPKADKP